MKKLEINRSDLEKNISYIKEIVFADKNEKRKIIAVVKSNGMGLGLIPFAKILIENDINFFAVATIEEAISLRKEFDNKILLMTPINEKKQLQLLIENDITLTVDSQNQLDYISQIIEDINLENIVNVHIKVDTGFGRYGILYSNIADILNLLEKRKNINIEGIFTHFSKPMDEKWTNIQFSRFEEVLKTINENGFYVEIKHASSSTATLKYPKMMLDAVRIGSAFQGRTLIKQDKFLKIGKFKTIVNEIKILPKGYNISYGNVFKTKKITKIAVIPVGYMDGLNYNKLRDDFSFKNNMISVYMELKKVFKKNFLSVKINGKKYKILGRLGMYHAIVDITDSENINIEDEVELDISPLQTNDGVRREYI